MEQKLSWRFAKGGLELVKEFEQLVRALEVSLGINLGRIGRVGGNRGANVGEENEKLFGIANRISEHGSKFKFGLF